MLMMVSDFPFVIETEGGYKGRVDTVNSWVENYDERNAIMGGTAQRVFGQWVVS